MKSCLLNINCPPVVFLVGEQNYIREIIRVADPVVSNWVGGTGVNPANPATFQPFAVNDIEYINSKEFLFLINNLTQDSWDNFSGTITQIADATSADGWKWFAAVFTKSRRHYSINSTAGDFWYTFENPYAATLLPSGVLNRDPVILAGQTLPYHTGTDPDLITNVVNTPGAVEVTYPKAEFVLGGAGISFDLPLYSPWANKMWVRPDGIAGVTATLFIHVF
jgi:hypothetical protein